MERTLNSEVVLKEKDLNIKFSIRSPTLQIQDQECQSRLQEQAQENQQQPDEEDKENNYSKFLNGKTSSTNDKSPTNFLLFESKSKSPNSKAQLKFEEEEDRCKTPTRLEQRIPLMPKRCPLAPRKPRPIASRKSKVPCCQRVLIDVSKEVDALFPAVLFADFGKKIKKARI